MCENLTCQGNSVFINGLSQGGSGNTTRLITLDGTSAGSSSDGLLLQGSGDSVSGLIIKDFHNGIEVAGATNTIGGTTSGAGNILSGNTNDGLLIDSGASSNQVLGNYIGINASGAAQANSGNGVEIAGNSNTIGGTAYGSRNIISGDSQDGVLIDSGASSNQVLGNFIGVNASGTAGVANINGIEVKGTGNTLGGTVAGSANIISGNSQDGVLIDSGASGNAVFGNNIGINVNGNAALANNNGIEVAGNNNTLGTSYGVTSNVLSGNSNDGVLIDSTASGNQILGNYIGTNNASTVALANKIGIEDGGSGNTLGGGVLGDRNVISGNSGDGVQLDSTATAETIQNNAIGLNANETAALANGGDGVEVKGNNNLNGGNSLSNYFTRNFISGNGHDGVLIDVGATGNQVQGNFIGVAVSGTNGVGNAANGIEIQGSSNTIGGTTSGLGNVVSGNGIDGILLAGMATNNLVQGNDAGTDYTGKVAVANIRNGVEVAGTGNTVGGTASGARNILSGNSQDGVLIDISGSGNQAQGNYIGINYSSAALGNSANGIEIAGSNNSIGGSVSGAGNTIAYNSYGGVLDTIGTGNTIRQNSIYANGPSNTGPGIQLSNGGNHGLGAPSITSDTVSGSTLTVQGTFNAPTANVSYVLEFFANPTGDAESKIYLGSLTVTPASTGTQNFTFTTTTTVMGTDPVITATLTDPSGDTSGDPVAALTSFYVLDMNTGETVPANATLNTFSTWSEDLQAQTAGVTVSSYSWNVTQAPDLTNVSGTTTANLQGTWANFTGTAHTDTISVIETPQSGSPLTQTITYLVAGTNSPAYSSSRPTSSSTWPTVITPDQISSGQATQAAGPYASIGLDDGSVQTSFSMPSYNPNTTPVSLDYSSTAANAQPIFLDEYQLPVGQSVPSTISAQLTFNGTALSTVTYNTSGLNAGDYMQIALQANATSLSTGRYSWSITVTNGSNQTTKNGNVDIVNQANSPFGAGWTLDNVEQLVSVTGGMMLVNPDGTSLYFASNGSGGYTTPAGDFSTLTLTGGVYTRTMPDGTKINFNSSGQQTSSVDRDGNTTTFGYTSGKVTTITDMNNQVTTLAYNGSGLLSTITDPDSRMATLTYTGNQLTSITDPANDVWQYSYDSANDLTKLTDPNTNATTFTYTSADRISSVTSADNTTEKLSAMQMNGWAAVGSSNVTAVLLAIGGQAQFTDGNNNVWTTGIDWLGFGSDTADIDPLGDAALTYRDSNDLGWMSADALALRTRDFFNSQGDATKIVQADDSYSQYQYNSFSEPTAYTDPTGDTTTYTYNSKGDMTQEEDALLNTWTYTYNSQGLVTSEENPLLGVTTHGYNSLNELTTLTNALNQTTTYAYNNAGQQSSVTDARGFTNTYSYDAMNRKTGETLADTSTTHSIYTYNYDKVGNQTSVEDPLLHTTTSTYDSLNRLRSVTDALNETTTYTYDANGNEISVTNPLNQTTTYGYDAANRQTTITNALNQTTTIGFDSAGEQTSITDPLSHTTIYTYTVLGQKASVTDPLGDVTAYTYNSAGDETTMTQYGSSNPSLTASMVYNADHEEINYTDTGSNTYTYTYDADGNQTTVTEPNNNITTSTYNQLNQMTSVEDPLGNVTTYGYDADGNRTTVTDPLNRTTTTVYDAQGRVLTVTNPLNGTITNTYDLAGNQTSITDPDSNTTTYTYDAANRLSSTINPTGYTATYDYDAAGEMTTMTDAAGRTITYSYDAEGRRTGETWVSGSYTATWTYDAAGNLSVAQDTYSKYSYGYDSANRLISVNNAGTPGVPQVTLTYSYDNYNDRTGLTDSLSDGISYTFDNYLRLTSMKLYNTANHIQTLDAQVTFSYDPASHLTGITRSVGDNITTTLTYDNANRLTNMATKDTTASLTLANYTYGYDKASQLTSYQDNNNSSLTYSYDNNGELMGEVGTLNGSHYSVGYSYDANGNRTMSGYSTGTGNELLSDGTYSYTYDHNGNMTVQTNISTRYVTYYTWDYRNRLVEVKQEDNHSNVLNDEKFTYDVDNNRIGVSLNETQQLYTVYDGSNSYMDFNGSGALTERYLTDPNGQNQFFGQVSASGTTQWLLTDNIGSIRQVVSTSGSVVDALAYDPYGSIVSQTNSANAPRFMYTGGAYDQITGDYQDGRRYEDPSNGRWISQDPLGFTAGDTNLYRYVTNDPTNAIDPSGLSIDRRKAPPPLYVLEWDVTTGWFPWTWGMPGHPYVDGHYSGGGHSSSINISQYAWNDQSSFNVCNTGWGTGDRSHDGKVTLWFKSSHLGTYLINFWGNVGAEWRSKGTNSGSASSTVVAGWGEKLAYVHAYTGRHRVSAFFEGTAVVNDNNPNCYYLILTYTPTLVVPAEGGAKDDAWAGIYVYSVT